MFNRLATSQCMTSPRLFVNNCRSLSSLAGKHLVSISALSHKELDDLINHSIDIKNTWKNDTSAARSAVPLKGQTMSMIFQKRSTRTRVSSESGFFMLGGHALMLGPQDVQLGVNESLKDTAKTLADLMTLKEHFGSLKGRTVSWVGDGNNVLHDLMIGSLKQGMHVRVATPPSYEPDADVVETAEALAKEFGTNLMFTTSAAEAVTGADVIVTDTWVSMGQESEAAKKKKDFAGYQVDGAMMARAAPGAVFLHCLPRKPEEVTDEVFYSKQSLVFPEAENRMWTLMAVALELLGKRWGK